MKPVFRFGRFQTNDGKLLFRGQLKAIGYDLKRLPLFHAGLPSPEVPIN